MTLKSFYIAAGLCTAVLFSACTKEGDTINNYGSSNSGSASAPKRTLLKEYGLADSSQKIVFTSLNNEIGKLKELLLYSSGVAAQKITIIYNGSNQPEAYQAYALPANTLSEQGTYKLDAKNRIVEVVRRQTNGDTIGISTLLYGPADYQPITVTYFDKSDNRISYIARYAYDSKGSLTKATGYYNGGSGLYKNTEFEMDYSDDVINPLNQLYPYVAVSAGISPNSSSALYFSNYVPSTVTSTSYSSAGDVTSTDITIQQTTADANGNLLTLNVSGQKAYVKY